MIEMEEFWSDLRPERKEAPPDGLCIWVQLVGSKPLKYRIKVPLNRENYAKGLIQESFSLPCCTEELEFEKIEIYVSPTGLGCVHTMNVNSYHLVPGDSMSINLTLNLEKHPLLQALDRVFFS